jgi:hypothetical protein
MIRFLKSWLRRWGRVGLLTVALLGGVGCQTLARTPEQQLRSAEDIHSEINPEFAPALEIIGICLYYVAFCFQYVGNGVLQR